VSTRRFFTPGEMDYLIAHYPNEPTQAVADALGMKLFKVYQKAAAMELKKSQAYLTAERERQGVRLRVAGIASRFCKGSMSWNKGKKGLNLSGGKGQFKKGNLPHNTLEDYAIRPRKYKTGRVYYYIRVAVGKWELYHRWLWMQEYGEIPKGHIIVFKDMDSMNCVLDNLELITKAENMKRNSLLHYPDEEIRKTIYQLAGLKRRIKTARLKNEK
jgi:hypothetical protein